MTAMGSGPPLSVDDVEVVHDRLGRTILVIPDPVAYALRVAVEATWQEARSMAYGQSELFPSWTWVYDITAVLMQVYSRTADSPDPTFIDATVIGESAWDPKALWWRDYDANRHLIVPGKAYIRHGCYRWEG